MSTTPTTEAERAPLTREQVAEFLRDWQVKKGNVGDYSQHQACTMSAAVALTRVRAGKDMNGATDNLECVDPVIRRLVIARNDVGGVDDAARKEFAIATIPLIVGTNGGKALAVKRAEHIVRYAIRVICAEAFEAALLPESAAKLRSIGDATPMSDCRAVATEARDAASRERDERYAAYADAYAAAYAYADAAAAAYAAARRGFRLKHLDQMIADCVALTE